jgi:hypothetical protein
MFAAGGGRMVVGSTKDEIMHDETPKIDGEHPCVESGWQKPVKPPRADARPTGLPPKQAPPAAKEDK